MVNNQSKYFNIECFCSVYDNGQRLIFNYKFPMFIVLWSMFNVLYLILNV